MHSKKLSIRDLSYIGVFTAIITICAQLSIPMPSGVPMTMQTFAILLAGVLLGKKNGALAALVYGLLGAVGAPVFAGFTGGLIIVLGPTGGFILSFPLMALLAGIGGGQSNVIRSVLWLLAGTIVNFLCGMLYFTLVTSKGLEVAFIYCVLPFLPTAAIKIALVVVFGKSLKAALAKSGVFAAK